MHSYTDELIRSMKRRLEQLEGQAALFGPLHTPAHIALEIEDTIQKIEDIQASSSSVVSLALLEHIPPLERWKRLYDSIWQMEIAIYRLQKNALKDRMRLKELDVEVYLLNRDKKRIYIIVIVVGFLIMIALYITAIIR